MKPKSSTRFPFLVAASVIALTGLIRFFQPEGIERMEAMTYDWRVKFATAFPSPAATNIGFVAIEDSSITALNNKLLGKQFGLYWQRQVYGFLVRELAAQNVRAVSFDVLFGEPRADHDAVALEARLNPEAVAFSALAQPDKPAATVDDLVLIESDVFFAWQMHRAGNVLLAAERKVLPFPLLRTNALGIGDISADRDGDGILRRARAFKFYRTWHPVFEAAVREFGVDLQQAEIQADRILLKNPDAAGKDFIVPIGGDGTFAMADFVGEKIPSGQPARAKPFTEQRVWHMGIVLAAQQLGLDLDRAEVDLAKGRIILRGSGGIERVIPVDANGDFYINWELRPNDPRLTIQPVEALLKQDLRRRAGETNDLANQWTGKLAIVGSATTGNDLTDWGSTPLDKETILVGKHWNVANSVLTGRFIHRTTLWIDLVLILLLGMVSAMLTWWPRPIVASLSVLGVIVLYLVLAWGFYAGGRIWLPVVLPVFGALLVEHLLITTYRVVFEQQDKRRIKSVFSRMVSPNIMHELLRAEKLSLVGARREITVYFADVRGFTEFTDRSREQAAQFVREHQLTGAKAEAVFEQQARETLETVNCYLALVADIVKQHEGTLDKYIGDCVMSFWGAPTPNPRHALQCVRAAIDAQRAIHDLNVNRAEENRRREQSNTANSAAGRSPLAPLPLLALGSGINTGVATVGLMGSKEHQVNYTVFGGDVNLASRLEALSGRGRIVMGENTYRQVLREDPALAATCVALAPEKVKGFRDAIQAYEVPWRRAGDAALPG